MPSADDEAVLTLSDAFSRGLTHPGCSGRPVRLIMTQMRQNSPDEMMREFAKAAGLPHGCLPRLAAEAVVHELRCAGFSVGCSGEV